MDLINEKIIWKFKSSAKKNYYDYFKDEQVKRLWEIIENTGKIKKDKISLEAGCGWGYFVRKMSEKTKKVYGVDFEKKMIMTCKKMCKGKKNIKIIHGDVRNLPFKNNFFDIIICLGVIEHFDETIRAVIELKRVLKEDGVIVLSVPSAYNFIGRILRHVAISRKKIPYYYQKHYTISSFKKVIFKAGLKINYLSGYGEGFWNIPTNISILKPLLKRIKSIFEQKYISLQKKDSSLVPYLSHMLIATCRKK